MLDPSQVHWQLNGSINVTANGRPIVSTDHSARNGVIHVLSSVMSSVYDRQGSVVSELDECCPEHSTLLSLVKTAGLYGLLDETGPYTFFAPLNSGFNKLHPDYILHLKKNLTALRTFVMGHVVPLTWYSPGFVDGQTVKTVIGNEVKIGVSDDAVTVGKATVQLPDITAGNGVVHVIDDVLFPDVSEAAPSADVASNAVFKDKSKVDDGKFVEALRKAGFVKFALLLESTGVNAAMAEEADRAGSAFTILAPTDEAFDRSRRYYRQVSDEDWARYHVGRGVVKASRVRDGDSLPTMLEGRSVVFNSEGKNTFLANGRPVDFHSPLETELGLVFPLTDEPMDSVYSSGGGSLFEEISSVSRFSRFAKLLRDKGLKVFLEDPQFSYTVLVPSDELFESGKIGRLMDYFIPDNWYTKSLLQEDAVATLGWKKLKIARGSDGTVSLDGSRLVRSDFTASNGVFHEIDDMIR